MSYQMNPSGQVAQFLGVPQFYQPGSDVVVMVMVDTTQQFYIPDSVGIFASGVTDVNRAVCLSVIDRKNMADNIVNVKFAWNDLVANLALNQEYVFMYIKSSTHSPVAISRAFRFQQQNQQQYTSNLYPSLNSQKSQQYASNQMPSNQRASIPMASNQMASNQMASNQMVPYQMPRNQMASNQMVPYQMPRNQMAVATQMPQNPMASNQMVAYQMPRNQMAVANQMPQNQMAMANVQPHHGFWSTLKDTVKEKYEEGKNYVKNAVGDPNHPHHGILSTIMSIFHGIKDMIVNLMGSITGSSNGEKSEHHGVLANLFSKVDGAHESAANARSTLGDNSPGGQASHQGFLANMGKYFASAKKMAAQAVSKFSGTKHHGMFSGLFKKLFKAEGTMGMLKMAEKGAVLL